MSKKRNPVYALQLSLEGAKQYLEKLCEISKEIKVKQKDTKFIVENPDKWKEMVLFHRALWIALIIEIGRIFDTYEKGAKKVISFKKVFKDTNYQKIIDSIHSEAIIAKIITTRNTFTAHIAEKDQNIASVDEICKSNLGELLERLDEPLSGFTQWFIDNKQWERL